MINCSFNGLGTSRYIYVCDTVERGETVENVLFPERMGEFKWKLKISIDLMGCVTEI